MAMLEVACPGCNTKLKAPDTSAGKKAKCKKCGTSFRLPGDPTGAAGDSQMLSAVDGPAAAEPNPFDMGALLTPPPPPPAPPKQAARPLASRPEPAAATDDPFNFGGFGEPEPAPPPPPPPARKSTPKADPVPEPKAKAKAKPKPPPPPPLDPFADEAPEAEPVPDALSLDDEPAAEPAASGDPFAFPGDSSPAPRGRGHHAPARGKAAEEPEESHPGAYRRGPQKSKAPLVALLLGLLALGAGVAVVVVVVTKKKDEPQAKAKDEKKEEKKEPDTPAPETKDEANKEKEDKDAKAAPKVVTKGGKGKTTPGKKSDMKGAGGGATVVQAPPTAGAKEARAVLGIGEGTRTIRFSPPAADAPPVKAQERRPLDLPLASVRLVIPPHNKATSDTVFVVQVSAGFQGQGEKLALERFSPVGMKRPERLEFAGDGKPVPACDVTDDTDLFAHAADGKLTVWKLADRSKVVDGWDVFADAPDHKKAGVAAVFFVTPDSVATVTTAGAVHAWELSSKKKLGEFAPAKGAAPGKVLAGKSVARTVDRAVVVVAVGGTIYRVGVKGGVGQAEGGVDLGGDVGRSLGLAVGESGKMLYVFETAPEARADGKKEKVVVAVPTSGRGQPNFVRWPEGVGEPESVGWANSDIAVVGTDKGRAFWLELSEERFVTLALLAPPGELARHAAGDAGHWALLPDPALPGKAVLLEYPMPPDGILEMQEAVMGGKPAPTRRLDPKGGGA